MIRLSLSLSRRQSFLRSRAAFTLVELLIVIAVIAILAVVVILVLNPIELLRQSRDSNRISDLSTLNTALASYNTDQSSGNMGSATTVYVSVPDSTSTCANLGLPTLPSGYAYGCATSANLRKTDGTGWVPVNLTSISFGTPLATLPIDPVNSTSTNQYYTYVTGGSWKLTAMSLESQRYVSKTTSDGGVAPSSYEVGNDLTLGSGIFPAGWVRVPGNSTFGTSDFWVMKYEAKCVLASSGASLIAPNSGSNTYANNLTPCTTSSYYIASTPGGYPIANISQTNAISYCTANGGHLITNNEWQTLAWNAQNVAGNWKNGVIGSTEAAGGLYRGNSNSALAMDGTNPLSGTNTRTLTLSNGSVVWDLAGNVWEWTSDTITGANQPFAAPVGFAWREFTAITSWGTMSQQTAGPSNASWDATNGIGRIYSDGTGSNSTVYGFLRGGDWAGGTDAGVGTLILNYGPSVTYYSIGFRCAR